MDDVEYILRIILKARDEMAAVLAKARTQIQGFTKDSDAMEKSVNKLNEAMGKFDGHMDGVTQKLQAWRAVLKDAGSDSKEAAKSLGTLNKEVDKSSKVTAALARSQDGLTKSADKLRNQYKELAKDQKEINKNSDFAAFRFKQLGVELENIAKKVRDTSTSRLYYQWAQDAKKAADAITSAKQRVAAETAKTDAAEEAAFQNDKRRHEEMARLFQRTEAVRSRIERAQKGFGRSVDPRDVAELRNLSVSYRKLGSEYESGSRAARGFAAESDRLKAQVRDLGHDSTRTSSGFAKLRSEISKAHSSAAGFDNQIRGMGILAAAAAIDQLISAAIALGGELVSLAGSAVMAGGALGGILAAGAAQALPVMGLLAGAVSRVKSVMDAFQKTQDLQKAQATDAEKNSQKAIDKTNALANASDTAASANENLAESRKALTKAQKDGVDQLEDLIYAEKQAALAARGAALDVKGAQEALQQAISTGASQLEIDQKRQALAEARLSQGRAGTTAKRATRDRRAAGGDVGNLEGVQSAAKAVEDAEKGVERANRGLEQAQDKTDRAASSTMTAAANLAYLLSQMSPAERKLLTAIESIYKDYQRIFIGKGKKDGIYGVIIDSFTRAVDEADKIMKMPKVIKSVQGLANEIGANINKVVDAIDPDTIDQILRIIDQAGDNMGPLVDGAIKLAKAFLNVSEAGNPAFEKLLHYLGGVVDKIVTLSEDDGLAQFFLDGEEHLESWLNLIQAVIGLFAELVGASADSGKKSIDDLTDKIKGWTDWLDEHHDQVVGFFEDARKAAYAIGGVLENVGATLFKSFSADRVEKFAKLLNEVLIPALSDVIDTVGKITDKVSKFLDDPTRARIAKFAVTMLLLWKIAGPIAGALVSMTRNILLFGKVIAETLKFVWRFIKYFDDIIRIALRLRPILMAVFTGPVAIIVAVVAAVVLLLAYFHRLDDVWRGLKDAFKIFLDAIQPSIESFKEAIEDLGIKAGAFKGVLNVLKQAGQYLADFIAKYLVETFKGLAKGFAGVAIIIIRTITGLIKIVKGVADVIIGLFTGDWDQVLNGLEGLVEGVLLIFGGIVEGIIKIFEGIVDIILSPFKAAWAAVKGFFGVKSPSKLAKDLGKSIIDGIKDGLVGLAKWITAPYRRAWKAVNDFFDGKPQKLAESIMDGIVDRFKLLWRRLRNAAKFVWEKMKDGFDAAKHFGGEIINAIVDGIKDLPGELLEAIKSIGSALVDVGKSIGGFIVDGIKAAFSGLKGILPGFLGGGDDKKGDGNKPAAAPQKPASTVSFDIGVGAIPFGAKDLKDAQNIYGEFWKELRKTARDSTDYIQRQFREMRIATTQSSDKMYKDIRGSLRDIQNSFKVRGGAATDNWSDTWLAFQKVAYDGLNYIGHQTNQALKGFGAKSINFGLSVPTGGGKGGRDKAGGGWIGNQGERGRDTIPTWLGRGEAVLNWAHQRVVEPAMNAMYGFGLDGLFQGTRALHAGPDSPIGFAAGGRTDTRLSRLVAAANRVDAMHLPYVWGGGHTQPAEIGKGMDCSGSVSYVVQQAGYKVPTVTSGNMPSWGMPGGSDGATVFYNPEHTFMRIGAKYFGTTGFGHPGWTGAGWFTQQPSADYLAGFSKIHLPGIGDVGNFAIGVGGEIAKLVVKGAKGAAKDLVQKAFDKVVPAANKYIGDQSSASDAGSGQWGDVKTVAAGAENIFRFFRRASFTDEQSAGWIGNLTQESGLNPGAVQPGGEGHGLAQWGHGRWDALQAFAKSAGKPWTDLGTQLNFIMRELTGSESAAMAAIKAATTVQQAVDAIGQSYERFGIAGNRSGPAEEAFRRFGGKFDVGGTVPGPDGSPVPILAHAGEWVLNKAQQSKIASWIGSSIGSVRDALGFSGGPTAYAGGGDVPTVKSITRRVGRGINYDDMLESVSKALDDVKAVMTGINRLGPKIKGIGGIIDLATKDGGLLDNLRSAIERKFAQANLNLRRAQLRVGAGRVVARAQDDVQVATGALAQRRSERGDLTDEHREIQKQLDAVVQRSKGAKKGSKTAQDLAAKQVKLQEDLDASNERVMQNTEDIFNAQEDLAKAQEEATQKRLDAFQAITDSIKDRFTKRTATNDLARRVATALGSPDLMAKVNENAASIVGDNLNELIGQLHQARTMGYTEQAAALQDDINELYTQATELAQQALRDQVDTINNAASRRMTRLDLFGRMADAVGVVSDKTGVNVGGETLSRSGVFQQRADTLEKQRSGLQGVLGQAQAAGNVGLVQELTDQLAELDVTIAENTKAAFDARVAEVTKTHDFTQSMADLDLQLVDLDGTITGQVDLQRKQDLLTQKGLDLQAKGQELTSLLAEATPGTQQYQDLQKAIKENEIATKQNTVALNEVTGMGTAPSSYTSTPWQWFNIPLLTGTGSVMPQYSQPGSPTVSAPSGGGGDAHITNNGGSNGATITNNFEINEAGGPIDVTTLSNTVVFKQSTAY